MKDFEYFVNLVFCGNTELDKKPYMPGINSDTVMAIGDYADAGNFDDIIDHFKDAAHQWKEYLDAQPKTISDISEEEFLARFK